MHFRRLTQQNIHWHINRRVSKVAVFQRQMALFGRFTYHGIRGAFTLANRIKQRHIFRSNRQHITLL
ncbi:Uncharacterised protein [Vibrio cholerae]|nr:Uncharacterised protein [Vibrio cholerae]